MEELTYTWKITSVKKTSTESLSDVIVQTYWTLTGEDADGNTGTFSGATPFTAENVNSENFTPFSDLTEETVIGWLKDIVVDGYWDHVNEHIMREIKEKKFVVEEVNSSDLPWAPPESDTPEPETSEGV